MIETLDSSSNHSLSSSRRSSRAWSGGIAAAASGSDSFEDCEPLCTSPELPLSIFVLIAYKLQKLIDLHRDRALPLDQPLEIGPILVALPSKLMDRTGDELNRAPGR
jgi:hypothetical protein